MSAPTRLPDAASIETMLARLDPASAELLPACTLRRRAEQTCGF